MPTITRNSPRVSVLLPVQNAETYLPAAIESIFGQTHADFELIAIDDGSRDRSLEILGSYSGDSRLRILTNDAPKGIVYTLNRGLSEAHGEFAARMDADDVSHPARFERQVKFLSENPEVAVAGTWANLITEQGEVFSTLEPPITDRDIKDRLVRRNALIHPSVMMRRAAVEAVGGYQFVGRSQDYDLWLRIAERFQLANIPEPLLDYRIHPGQVSTRLIAAGHRARTQVKRLAFERNPDAWQAQQQPVWRRLIDSLVAAPGSLGDDFLGWAHTYELAGNHELSRRLVLRALLNSPLSAQAHSLTWNRLVGGALGRERVKALRWYFRRLKQLATGRNG